MLLFFASTVRFAIVPSSKFIKEFYEKNCSKSVKFQQTITLFSFPDYSRKRAAAFRNMLTQLKRCKAVVPNQGSTDPQGVREKLAGGS